MLRSTSLHTLAAGHCVARLSVQRCIATTLEQWQRRCDRLTSILRRIKFPRLREFEAGGKTYALPLRSVAPPRDLPTQAELEYLVGFFDGDGCVSMPRANGQVTLRISQAVDSAQILTRFREALGGGIYQHGSRTGARQATLCWNAGGDAARQAAQLMSSLPCVKRRQLEIAAQGPIRPSLRNERGDELKSLKWNQRPEVLRCSWRYLAGFFDAEGCITIGHSRAPLRLQLGQVSPGVLESILTFLRTNNLHRWQLYSCSFKSYFSLCCWHFATSKQTLEHMLDAGLLVKQKQAELALSLTASNKREVRNAVSELNGLQNRYNRLDEDGIERSMQLQRLYQKLRKTGCQQKVGLLQSELQELQTRHALLKLQSKCDALRRDIRQSLREGGAIQQSESARFSMPDKPDPVPDPYVSLKGNT